MLNCALKISHLHVMSILLHQQLFSKQHIGCRSGEKRSSAGVHKAGKFTEEATSRKLKDRDQGPSLARQRQQNGPCKPELPAREHPTVVYRESYFFPKLCTDPIWFQLKEKGCSSGEGQAHVFARHLGNRNVKDCYSHRSALFSVFLNSVSHHRGYHEAP